MIDWTFALLFRPDIVKISLDTEAAMLLREEAAAGLDAAPQEPNGAQDRTGTRNYQHAPGGSV
jgi:hypothetical protein